MKRKPLSDADRAAAASLRRIWDEKKSILGLTQDKAAEKLGFNTQGAVSHYLNGYTPLNTDAVLKFAHLLHVSPADIRPDITDLLVSAENLHSGLSETATEFIKWFTEAAINGRLSDAEVLRLKRRAEEIADSHAPPTPPSDVHDWIAGGRSPLPPGSSWKRGKLRG